MENDEDRVGLIAAEAEVQENASKLLASRRKLQKTQEAAALNQLQKEEALEAVVGTKMVTFIQNIVDFARKAVDPETSALIESLHVAHSQALQPHEGQLIEHTERAVAMATVC